MLLLSKVSESVCFSARSLEMEIILQMFYEERERRNEKSRFAKWEEQSVAMEVVGWI